jgi:PhzF family phenazine biosynthesis protein
VTTAAARPPELALARTGPGRDAEDMSDIEILRYAAFSDDPSGGNPAGVVLAAGALSDAEMLAVAAEVGYSETAFLTEDRGAGVYRVRYFSPLAEVPFCGHATVGTAVALADRHGPGPLVFVTNVGEVPVTVDDRRRATLTSVATRVADLPAGDLAALLAALRWDAADLDPALPPRVAYAGAYHPVIAAATRQRLAELDYDVPVLKALMEAKGWTTVQLVWREAEDRFDVRNPFPVGGVYEDPATGAAAAALGGYVRAQWLVPEDAIVHLAQGDDLGRPGRLTVTLTPGEDGVRVSGTAVPIPA